MLKYRQKDKQMEPVVDEYMWMDRSMKGTKKTNLIFKGNQIGRDVASYIWICILIFHLDIFYIIMHVNFNEY